MIDKLSLGTAQFGSVYGINNTFGKVSPSEVKNIITIMRESGANSIDTAMSYGNAEKILGNIGVTDFDIVTKLSKVPRNLKNVKNWSIQRIKNSLQNLKLESVHGILLHDVNEIFKYYGSELIEGLQLAKQLGLTRKIGISIYDPITIYNIRKVFKFDIIQAPLNICDRRLATDGWLKELQAMGVEIHVRSLFLQGLLLLRADELPTQFSKYKLVWGKKDELLKQLNISGVDACLSYVNEFKEIARYIVGLESTMQLREIIESCSNNRNLNNTSFLSLNYPELIDPRNWTNKN